jgi:hypothetical protein
MAAADVILAEIERGGVRPVYLLLGEDRGSKEEVVEAVKKSLFKSMEETAAGSSIFYGDEAPVYEIIEALSTSSIFSAKRLVVVHDFDRIGNKKPLLEYTVSPDNDTVLILLSEKNSVAKTVTNAVARHGKAATFWPMFHNEGERWLSRYLKQLGVNAEQETRIFLHQGARQDHQGAGAASRPPQFSADSAGAWFQKERIGADKQDPFYGIGAKDTEGVCRACRPRPDAEVETEGCRAHHIRKSADTDGRVKKRRILCRISCRLERL